MRELQGGLGMPGGPRNPLGSRALYLWHSNKDTLNHLLGRIPVRPFLLVVDGRCARPPEVLAPYADAIAERPPATLDERLIAELRPQPPPSPA